MNRRPHLHTIALALMFSATSMTMAQDTAGIKPQTTSSGIEYVSGGVGDKQQNAMKAMREDYNLQLTFARPKSGEYLADVKVTVENTNKEKVLDATSSGPLMFAKLPSGTYNVMAEFEGQRQVKKATIKDRQPRGLIYYFEKK